MKTVKWLPSILLLLAPMTSGAVEGVTANEIRLGMVNARSGPAAGLGNSFFAGADAYFRQVNAAGGINGRKVVLVTGDDGYEPAKTVKETLRLIEKERIFALIGYVGTPTSTAAVPLVHELRVPLIGVFSGAMTLRRPAVREVINIRASYNDETRALMDRFAAVEKAERVGVFFQDDSFGMAVLNGVKKAIEGKKMKIVSVGSFQRNTTDILKGLETVTRGNPDVIVMAGPYAPVAAFIKEVRRRGIGARLATVSFVGTEQLLETVGVSGEGVMVSQVVPLPHDMDYPVVRECARVISESPGTKKPDFISLEGCVTAKAMKMALERTGKDLTRTGLINAFESMKEADLGGIPLDFSAGDHQGSDAVFLTEIKAGKVVEISGASGKRR
ncbi:MAG: ABC transporter substrate-binding protein [Nitrospirota bacterium]|nr:ABC transporter substrate-binding protein [Nitrospirota bacterium]